MSLLVTVGVLLTICKHTKLKSLATNFVLQQIKEVGTMTKQEHISILHDIECICKTQRYTICMLNILILGIVVIFI